MYHDCIYFTEKYTWLINYDYLDSNHHLAWIGDETPENFATYADAEQFIQDSIVDGQLVRVSFGLPGSSLNSGGSFPRSSTPAPKTFDKAPGSGRRRITPTTLPTAPIPNQWTTTEEPTKFDQYVIHMQRLIEKIKKDPRYSEEELWKLLDKNLDIPNGFSKACWILSARMRAKQQIISTGTMWKGTFEADIDVVSSNLHGYKLF